MSAKQKNGIAVLEEFLQEKYVEKYEDFEENSNRIANFVKAYPEYFYVPREKGFGVLDYIEYNGKAFYLIEKENLPEEIKEQLVGGDAGKGEYTDYLGLNDVYGVNSKLKVYYCSNGMETIENLGKDEIDEAKERDVFSSASTSSGGLGSLLSAYDGNKDGKIQSSEISSITELEITEAVDLKEIYNLYSLEKLIIKEVTDIDLTGIENCMKLNHIWFYKSSAKNYEPIGKLGSKLNKLYFSHITDDYLKKLCDDLSSYDLSNLQYLGFFGSTGNYTNGPLRYMSLDSREFFGGRIDGLITDLSPLDNLKDSTKLAVKYLYLEGNQIERLEGLDDFTNLISLKIYGNNLSDISSVKNMESLEYLQLHDNKFLDKENVNEEEKMNDALYYLSNLGSLRWLDISTNSGIRRINYLNGLKNLKYLYMDGCNNLSNDDIISMKKFINSLTDKSYDSKYEKKLINSSTQTSLSYYGETIDFTEFKIIGECTKLTHLNLRNTKVVRGSSENINDHEDTVDGIMTKVFKNLTSLQELTIRNLTINFGSGDNKIENLKFLEPNKQLVILDLRDTDVIAKGDDVSLDDNKKSISIENTKILNGLTQLNCIGINTDKFDFSKLQDMLNRFFLKTYSDNNDKNFWGCNGSGYGGLYCSNWNSLQTLSNCSEIKNLYSYLRESIPLEGEESILDLSGCDSLKIFDCMYWSGFAVKFPNCIEKIRGTQCTIENDFEENEDGSPVLIEEIKMCELNGSKSKEIVEGLRDKNIKVNKLIFANVYSNYSFVDSLLKNGVCDWISNLSYNRAYWNTDVWNKQLFIDDLYLLKNSSVTGLTISYCPEKDLNFLKDLVQLKKITITESKVTDISALEPIYDQLGKCISGFPDLEELTIENSVTDISSVGTLTNLKRLNVSGNKINNGIEKLEELKQLEYVNLSNCSSLSSVTKYVNVGTKEPLESFVNIFKNLHENGKLKELYLNGTGIKNIKSKLENPEKTWTTLNCDS